MELAALPPPTRSKGVLHDLYIFLARRPAIPTLMAARDPDKLDDHLLRIRQRIGISVAEYAVLNVHSIGIEAPVGLVFEELLTWHDASAWWPNHLASIDRVNGDLGHIRMVLFGTRGSPIRIFNLNAIRIQRNPGPADFDNARYVLYKTSGGYPIGVFGMYVRSQIAARNEKERSKLFFLVSFNFYGKKDWPHRRVINPLWEWVHNRVTANILNRFKRLCEWRFAQLQKGL
ncbi:MAG: hypothetical protein ACYTKC_14780 [Planctomycetota bacterium]|jgi:hypothetical protein